MTFTSSTQKEFIMRLTAILIVSAMLSAIETIPVEWKNIGPGGGGWVQSLLASRHDASVVYIGGDVGGFYRSRDGGQSYTTHNDGLEDYWVECIVEHPTDPSIIYLGCQYGVYRSEDRGKSWRIVNSGFPPAAGFNYSAPIGALAIDEKDPKTLYAGIGKPRPRRDGGGAVYMTVDDGAHWKRIDDGISLPKDATISALAVDTRNSEHLYLCCQYGFFQSVDGGVSWKNTAAGIPHPHVRLLGISRSNPDIMYVSVFAKPNVTPYSGGIFRSSDGGSTWTKASGGLNESVGKSTMWKLTAQYDCIAVHPSDPDTVHVGGIAWVNDGMYKTTDGGKSWRRTMQKSPGPAYGWIDMWGPAVECLSISIADPNVLYFGTSGMIFISKDGGDSWNEVYSRSINGAIASRGFEILCIRKTIVHPERARTIYVACMDIGLMISDDGGATFRRSVPKNPKVNSLFDIAFDPADKDHLWGTFGERDFGGFGFVAESKDGGTSWAEISSPEAGLPASRMLDILSVPGEKGVRLVTAAEKNGVYLSDDGGRIWSAAAGIPKPKGAMQLFANGRALYCLLRSENKLFTSSDAGRTWKEYGDLSSLGEVRMITPSGNGPLIAAVRKTKRGDTVYDGGVFLSDDGRTWRSTCTDNFASSVAVDPKSPDIIVAGFEDHPFHDRAVGSGIRMSRDGGKTWASLNSASLHNRNISTITLDPHDPKRIYAGTGGNSLFVGTVER